MIKTLILILTLTAAAVGQLNVNAPKLSAPANDVVTIPFDVTNSLAITSFQFNISFNPVVLTPTDDPCAIGDLAYPLNVICNASESGIVRMAAYGATNFSGDGTILLVTFYTHTGATPLKLTQNFFFNQAGRVPSIAHNGSVTLE